MADLAGIYSLAGWRTPIRAARIRPGALAGVAALALSIVLLFALGLVIAANQNGLRARFALIQHTDDVLLQVASIRQDLQRMESDMRAYGLDGDGAHLTTWMEQKADSDARLARLAGLLSDNPAQVARLAALRPEIAHWTARWSDTAMHPSPGALVAVRDRLAEDLRQHPGRRIHGGLNALAGVERLLLEQRQVTAARLTDLLEWLSLVLALAAPTIGAAGIALLVREGQQARRRELQMQLAHSQRLALMGETASMLAHELNQPLTAARNYLAVAKRGQEGAQAEVIVKADGQIGRAAAILQRLRNFIEKRDNEQQAETCASLVADAVALLGTVNRTVQLHTQLESGLPLVLVDRIQIQQVLVNLMRNAIEAMAGGPGREMWLSVARGTDGRIVFRLRDAGPGLSPDVAGRLFQPFTTTKADGMGIGLSICQRILQDHGGEIWTETVDGGGACFCFALPVAG